MLGSILFTVAVFGLLSMLAFFIARHAPTGQYRSREYTSLPGVMTPNTLRSKDAWVKAHEATSSGFTLLAVYFSIAGVVFIALLFYDLALNYSLVFGLLVLLGIAGFAVLVIVGDRTAAKFNRVTSAE